MFKLASLATNTLFIQKRLPHAFSYTRESLIKFIENQKCTLAQSYMLSALWSGCCRFDTFPISCLNFIIILVFFAYKYQQCMLTQPCIYPCLQWLLLYLLIVINKHFVLSENIVMHQQTWYCITYQNKLNEYISRSPKYVCRAHDVSLARALNGSLLP